VFSVLWSLEMPRLPTADEAAGLYHALNRGNLRSDIFHKEGNRVVHDRVFHGPRRMTSQQHIHERLQQSPYHELKSVSCRFHEGIAILEGRVSSFYLKQVAQTLLRDVDDVQEIVNRLVVIYPADTN